MPRAARPRAQRDACRTPAARYLDGRRWRRAIWTGAFTAPSGQRALHVVAQETDLGFFLFVLGLDDVADRDDGHQASILDNRQVADAALGHHAHHVIERVVRDTDDDFAGHHVADFLLERCPGIFLAALPEDVALRNDADQGTFEVENRKGADV